MRDDPTDSKRVDKAEDRMHKHAEERREGERIADEGGNIEVET